MNELENKSKEDKEKLKKILARWKKNGIKPKIIGCGLCNYDCKNCGISKLNS